MGVFAGEEATSLADETLPMERGHAEALIPCVERVLAATPGGWSAITRIAVTVGPGSFTGLRIGIAAARGFALALDVPVVGVSTLAAHAAPLVDEGENSIIAVAIDARHGEVFFQSFAPGGRTLVAARAISLREASRAIGSGPARIVGSAGPALAIDAWSLGVAARVTDPAGFPPIRWVARLGLAMSPASALPRPLYIKAPGATPAAGATLPMA